MIAGPPAVRSSTIRPQYTLVTFFSFLPPMSNHAAIQFYLLQKT
jgi:hypothetical protein